MSAPTHHRPPLHGLPYQPPTVCPTAHWPHSLGTGALGILMSHASEAHANRGSWATVHTWANAVTQTPVTTQEAGLYQGAPAFAYALAVAANPLYRSARNELDRHIDMLTTKHLQQAHTRIDRGHPPALREYDLISGLTGLGAYLLRTRQTGARLVAEVLSYLVRLTLPLPDDRRPGWWTGHGPTDTLDPVNWPHGHGNCGIAHGITGPLAVLATAHIRDQVVPGHKDAIERILEWLDHVQHGSVRTARWPGIVGPRHTVDSAPPSASRAASWCYGTPGIARAQQLAALAIGDAARRADAEAALVGCITDNTQLADLGNDMTLCHGWAGLVRATDHAAAAAGPDSDLAQLLPHLRTRFTQLIRANDPLGHPGLLDGAAGLHLTRTTSVDAPPGRLPWDTCLLLPT